MTDNSLHDQIAAQQQQWHGWGSPVGVGLGFALAMIGIAAVLASISAMT
jgi:hypothetical protein